MKKKNILKIIRGRIHDNSAGKYTLCLLLARQLEKKRNGILASYSVTTRCLLGADLPCGIVASQADDDVGNTYRARAFVSERFLHKLVFSNTSFKIRAQQEPKALQVDCICQDLQTQVSILPSQRSLIL